jgi:hypothetical protein
LEVRWSKFVSTCSNICLQAISILTDVLRDGLRNAKLKAAVLPAVGELLFLVTTHVRLSEMCFSQMFAAHNSFIDDSLAYTCSVLKGEVMKQYE